jgi:hypothetical protein
MSGRRDRRVGRELEHYGRGDSIRRHQRNRRHSTPLVIKLSQVELRLIQPCGLRLSVPYRSLGLGNTSSEPVHGVALAPAAKQQFDGRSSLLTVRDAHEFELCDARKR